MSEELLVPFYTEEYETPSDAKIMGGPNKYKRAYCYKKTFALGSDEAKKAHEEIERLKGYELRNIEEEPVDKVRDISNYFGNKLYDLYDTEESILGGIEHIKDNHSPIHVSRDIEEFKAMMGVDKQALAIIKDELLNKEKRVLGKMNDVSFDNEQENEKARRLLGKLKESKIEISRIESIKSNLDEIINAKTQSEEKKGTPKV